MMELLLFMAPTHLLNLLAMEMHLLAGTARPYTPLFGEGMKVEMFYATLVVSFSNSMAVLDPSVLKVML
jgi:hypothetical protein